MRSYKDFEVGKQYTHTLSVAIYTCIAKTPTEKPVLCYSSKAGLEVVFIPREDQIRQYIEYIPDKWVNLYWNHNKTRVYVGTTHSSKESAETRRDAIYDTACQYIMSVKVQ